MVENQSPLACRPNSVILPHILPDSGSFIIVYLVKYIHQYLSQLYSLKDWVSFTFYQNINNLDNIVTVTNFVHRPINLVQVLPKWVAALGDAVILYLIIVHFYTYCCNRLTDTFSHSTTYIGNVPYWLCLNSECQYMFFI